MNTEHLIDKYSVAAPRYTSYPTVPYWDQDTFDGFKWKKTVQKTFKASNGKDGISLYIHLPFCESLCTYCGCNTRITKNHGVELPYIEAVLMEWEMYCRLFSQRPLIREIHLGGGTPTFFSARNLKTLIDGIFLLADKHEQAEFSFEGHPSNTSRLHLKSLFGLGFKRLSLGIQDFDLKVQRAINRIQSVEEVALITELARSVGYTSINYDLIYGLPMQHMEGLRNTVMEVLKLRPDRIAFYSYAHVPWVKKGQRHFSEADLPGPDEKQKLYELGRKLLREAGYTEIGMDHFTLQTDSLSQAEKEGTLHRNFMGYTHQYSKLMIGLGVSAISDTWNAFAQNVKVVEEYLHMVGKGQLPVVKGHLLHEEDLVIRKHIINIMCQGQTTWRMPGERNNSFFEGLERMRWLAQDGLVILSEEKLTVTLLGKRFLRNICMALDARLHHSQPENQLFSVAG
ncbi:oxygen-independent coproporphyrinogen III oxidase [Pedobacter sp. GR22-6]|uniref:oxygen-independent coproporphyrinogen III oxidase n=1 Tax=Pedobacter sp. GR22-6 TaxID=3127957 RepID=UPI00307E0712